jgi:hypothetical protein
MLLITWENVFIPYAAAPITTKSRYGPSLLAIFQWQLHLKWSGLRGCLICGRESLPPLPLLRRRPSATRLRFPWLCVVFSQFFRRFILSALHFYSHEHPISPARRRAPRQATPSALPLQSLCLLRQPGHRSIACNFGGGKGQSVARLKGDGRSRCSESRATEFCDSGQRRLPTPRTQPTSQLCRAAQHDHTTIDGDDDFSGPAAGCPRAFFSLFQKTFVAGPRLAAFHRLCGPAPASDPTDVVAPILHSPVKSANFRIRSSDLQGLRRRRL